MSERVSVFEGKSPVIVIAPHTLEDEGTAEIAERIIKSINCYGVINRGWINSIYYDYDDELANCNNIEHIHEDVIKHEFLFPILRYQIRIRKKHTNCFVLIIHGCGREARAQVNDPTLDMIVGYGAGKPPAYSCDLWRKDYFVHCLESGGITTYEAKPKSVYSARNKKNLNQLFNMGTWYPDKYTNSLQLQIIHDLRDKDIACITGDFIADSVKKLIEVKTPWRRPAMYKPKLI